MEIFPLLQADFCLSHKELSRFQTSKMMQVQMDEMSESMMNYTKFLMEMQEYILQWVRLCFYELRLRQACPEQSEGLSMNGGWGAATRRRRRQHGWRSPKETGMTENRRNVLYIRDDEN